MKKMILCTLATLTLSGVILFADDAKQNPQNARPMLHEETDNTDIYAIPLDLSEEEENKEIQELDSKK